MKNFMFISRAMTCSRSFRMNCTYGLFSVILLFCMAGSSSAQLFFREYAPATEDATNDGRCIIRPAAGNDKLLSVGQYWQPNQPLSGHGIWTNYNGTLNAATTYNRTAYDDNVGYTLNFIEERMVSGSYDAAAPYSYYTGHPAVGTKVLEIGDTAILYPITWTTIIDPTDRDRKWDHIITNVNDDISFGKSLVRDQTSTNNFCVLSEISNNYSSTLHRFGVTKYAWVGGYNGHQVAWSFQYSLDGYQLYPVGIVQGNDDELVVAGNIIPNAGGNTRIFACQISHTTGAISNFRIYYPDDPITASPNWEGNVVANSITGPFTNGHFLIAGKVTRYSPNTALPGIGELPMIFSINSNLTSNKMAIYPYKRTVNYPVYMNGEFNCAKEVYQRYGTGMLPVPRITAVGKLGDSSTYPGASDAFVMNASNLNTLAGVPGWAVLQGVDFTSGTTPTATTAKWFVSTPDTVTGNIYFGQYIYTGVQSDGGITITHAIEGSVRKTDGTTECYTTPYSDGVIYPTVVDSTKYPDSSAWGTDMDEPTAKAEPELSPLKCTNDTSISAGKHAATNEPITGYMTEVDKATITVVGDALTIKYSSPEETSIKLVVVDLMGNIIVEQRVTCSSGTHYYTIDTKEWIMGTYFVGVIGARSNVTKKVLILR